MNLRLACLIFGVLFFLFAVSPLTGHAELVHHYTFDNEDASDAVGGMDGTLNGDPGYVTGQSGLASDRAILLNPAGGDGQYVSFAPHTFGEQFSLSTWLRPGTVRQTNSNISIAANSNGGFATDGFRFFVNNWQTDPPDARIILETGDGGSGNNSGSPTDELPQDDQWHHVALTVDKSTLTKSIYHNGANVHTGSFVDFSDNQTWSIGGFANGATGWIGAIDEFAVFDEFLSDEAVLDIFENGLGTAEPFTLSGDGESYLEDFDIMETNTGRMPKGWTGETTAGLRNRVDSLGLVDGPLDAPGGGSVAGIVNAGGNPERFSSPADARLGTWQDDLDGSGVLDEGDVIADDAADRALGNARVLDDEVGNLLFQIEISDRPLRALIAEWDLEVWGGDPESTFRGAEGAGYAVELSVGGTSYYSEIVSLTPGALFDSAFDQAPGATNDPTLINGNEHAVRDNSSGIIEIDQADGAVGNSVQFSFDADFGAADGGWIPAVDNVLVRALAAGDAQADGDVDPADLIQLLAGGAFGQGNIDATWGQGDFDNDGDFDGTDILAVVQGLAGEFPKTYAHDPNNGVPDVLINPATGNITLDTNGTTIGSIVMDSAAGIFNGPNSPSWDAPGDFAADIDTQISMPISFTNPGYSGVDDLGDGIIGDLAPGFDILADLTIKYLDPNGDLLDAEAHVVPEPSSIVLVVIGLLGILVYARREKRLS